MRQIELIKNYIRERCIFGEIIEKLQNGQNPGISAHDVQNKFNILRSNASSILNTLYKEKSIVKINSRPVTFLPYEIICRICEQYKITEKNLYTLSELQQNIVDSSTSIKDPFAKLLGWNGSLLYQIRQAKAAIVYPPRGLHTLLLGESGVGKTTFAQAMHDYGELVKGKTPSEYPFITFNCADYFNNPQLLLSQLFGHAKNAFTGANMDKPGLVEQADGGILFLDEIHRLPPDGQEMLFYLMDKGEYNRLGDGNRRKSNVLIIAATTEEPSTALLNTFVRRIPVNIKLPKYKEKTIFEKVEIINYFFRTEAINIKKTINIAPEVLKALALYEFKDGNIGQLRSEIKLLCANAFLQYLQNNQTLYVYYQSMNKDIRDVLFNYEKIDINTRQYLDTFSEDIIIRPQKNKDNIIDKQVDDIYDIVITSLNNIEKKKDSATTLECEIDAYFKNINKYFSNLHSQILNPYKFISKDIIEITLQLIDYAKKILHVNFNNYFLFELSLYIQMLLKKHDKNFAIDYKTLSKITAKHPEEFNVVDKIVEVLSDKFGILIGENEKCFLSLLLYYSKVKIDNKKIGMIIICHGESTATSIADVCNKLLHTHLVKAIDMLLTQSIDETYNKLKTMALHMNNGKGLILLIDMGSLLFFDKRLTAETGIKVKLIKSVSTPLALEVLHHILYDVNNIDEFYIQNNEQQENTLSGVKRKPLAILAICATGKGSSIIIKNILDNLLNKYYMDIIKVVTTDYLHTKNVFKKINNKYYVIASVGNIDPQLPIPFFPINQLLQKETQQIFFHLLDGNVEGSFSLPQYLQVPTPYETAKKFLEKYVKFINPRYAIFQIRKFMERIDYIKNDKNIILDLILHMGCVLDRCIGGINIQFDDLENFRSKNKEIFKCIHKALEPLENEYNIVINDAEIAYITKIIITKVK